MGALKRLSVLLHWISFLIFSISIILFILGYLSTSNVNVGNLIKFMSLQVTEDFILMNIPVASYVVWVLGFWLAIIFPFIRWVLFNEVVLLPWKTNKKKED